MSLPGWCEYEDDYIHAYYAYPSPSSTEYKEFARHCMWRRLFGYIPTKGEKKAYAASMGLHIFQVTPCTEDYLKTAEMLPKMIEERAKHPHLTINPFEQEKDVIIRNPNDYIFFDDFLDKDCNPPMTTYSLVDNGPCAPTQAGQFCSSNAAWTITIPQFASAQHALRGCGEQPSKKENNMGYEISTAFIENDQRRHLKSRLQNVRWAKDTEMTEKFHMGHVKIKDKDDLIAAMKDGRLQVRDEAFSEDGKLHGYYSYMDTLVFRDKDRDEKGYKAASETLDKAFVAAADKITVLTPKEGLDVLTAFEAQTF